MLALKYLLTIAGGVALLLFGVRYLRRGLDRLFGRRLSMWMNRLAGTRGSAFLSGLGLAIICPSSTTMSLLAVQTVQQGHMSARQLLTLMLGANIGLTILVQLLALHIDQYAPIAILFGVILYQFTRTARSRGIGQVLLALGFIFLAMGVIRDSVVASNLAEQPDFIELIDLARKYPLILAILAAILTTLLQSSTATIGLLIGLSTASRIDLGIIIPFVLGANVGMAITTLLVGWNRIESRRLALANLLLKSIVALPLIFVFMFIQDRLPEPTPDRMPMITAQLHTGYNLLLALCGLPGVAWAARLMEKLVPEPTNGKKPFGPKFIHHGPMGGAALALGQSLRELIYMAEIIRSMLDDTWIALKNNNEPLARAVSERDDLVDQLDHEIKIFLTRIVKEEVDDYDAADQMRQLRFLSELETIGDIIDKNLTELVLKKIRLQAVFSTQGEKELTDFYSKVVQNLEIAITAFTTRDRTLASQLLRHKERLNKYEEELRDRHFQRLNRGENESHETSAIHLDLLTHLKRINSSLSHVAYAILADPPVIPAQAGIQ